MNTAVAAVPVTPPATNFTSEDLIPMTAWSKDHWSTLAYVESVMTECAGFQMGLDPRMKSNRRNFRVMSQHCPRPKRPGSASGRAASSMAMPMDAAHATVVKGGQMVPNHDDWSCLQDMADEGLFTVGQDRLEPREMLHFSAKGIAIAAALRAHKANGGKFADFVPPA